MKPKAILFDLFETVFSLEAVRKALLAAGHPDLLELWFARTLRDGFALAASAKHKPFPEIAGHALEGLIGHPDPALLASFKELDAHPDAAPAFEAVRRAGVRLGSLSNGSEAGARGLLERNGLQVERVLSIDHAGRWKPHRDAYLTAVQQLGLAPSEVALIAVHSWDVHGARAAGLRTGWCSRLEKKFNQTFDRAEVEGATLPEVVARLCE